MRTVLLTLGLLLAVVASPLHAQVPSGAPAGTYNAAPTTSGAFVNGDSLYAGNPGFESYIANSNPPQGIVTYKVINVTERSRLWRVTGNGFGPTSRPFPTTPSFELVVHPVNPTVVLSSPVAGSIVPTEQLEATQQIDKGQGVSRFDYRYDLMLQPTDGEGFVLEPGQYYVAVQGYQSVAGAWVWSELRPSSAQSDMFWADGLGSILTPIIGQRLLGGQIAQTGVAAFDVWMTPTDDMGVCNSYRAGATGYSPIADRPYMLLADPYTRNEIHEEDEQSCQCANGNCAWTPTGMTRFRVYDLVGSCSVIAEGTVNPYVNPFPDCQLIGLQSTSKMFEIPGFGPILIREQCTGSNLNGYNWPDHTFLSAAYPTTPKC